MRLTVIAMLVATVGCAGANEMDVSESESDGSSVASTSSALELVPPQGMACGLGYYKGGVAVQQGYCNGAATGTPMKWRCGLWATCISMNLGPPTSNAHIAFDGDYGLPANWGYYHQVMNGLSRWIPEDTFKLPAGTTCGFKESCNDGGETCLGYDPKISCPPGWVQRSGEDRKAPSGCGFFWCEYQDPNGLCTGSCAITAASVPSGTVCGLNDDQRETGRCLGYPTTYGCPPGWTYNGIYDDGRSSGQGLNWCSKP